MKFAFPLYYPTEKLTWTFSDRLPTPDGHISRACWSDTVLAAEFAQRVEPFRAEVKALDDLEGFGQYLLESCTLRRPIIRKAYALTLIMLGEAREALEHLKKLRNLPEVERGHPNC